MPGSRSKVIVTGLTGPLGDELIRALRLLSVDVAQEEDLSAEVAFCQPSDVDGLRRRRPDVSVVVVSPQPEVDGWLNAIEAGAADYCAAPFELTNLDWVLQSTVRPSVFRAV
jgi:DNA-binding response OmpR family regulator